MSAFEIISTEELIKRLAKYTYKQLHVHHTWKPNHTNFNGKNHITLQQSMKNHHVNTNKWTDIGQHVTLMPDGLWVTGRAFNQTPASITGWNTGAFAVEMLGDFDKGMDKFEGKQKESMIKLSRYFVDRFGKDCIKFHREGPNVAKTCPGTGIDKNEFMKEVMSMGSIFKDVEDNRWSAKDIEKAKALGLIAGDSNGNFNPTGPLTREQAAVIMIRLYEAIKEGK